MASESTSIGKNYLLNDRRLLTYNLILVTVSVSTTTKYIPMRTHNTNMIESKMKIKRPKNNSSISSSNSFKKDPGIKNRFDDSQKIHSGMQKLPVVEDQTIMVPHSTKGPFSVAKQFWELSTKNTKNIFDVVPPSFLPNMKNPCFWEDYKLKGDPYANSPYAPKVGDNIKYDPSGHNAYFEKARARFNAHLIVGDNGKTKRLRCLPYFYLISTPKSGTTTLWNQLRKHF